MHVHTPAFTQTHKLTRMVIWASLQLWSCAKNFPRPKLFNYFLRWSCSLSRCLTCHHNQHQNHRCSNDATYSLKQSRVSDTDVQKFTIWTQLNVILCLISAHFTIYFIHIWLQDCISKHRLLMSVIFYKAVPCDRVGICPECLFFSCDIASLWTYKVTFCKSETFSNSLSKLFLRLFLHKRTKWCRNNV